MKHAPRVVSCVSIVAALQGTALAAPDKLDGRTAALILDLARRATVDPHAAAKVLCVEILSIEQVSAYRREYQLAANTVFADITAIVGGQSDTWRVIDLVPRDDVALTLTPFVALLLDAPYEAHPFIKHHADGPEIAAVDHHFVVGAGELVIRTSPHSTRIERIALTTARTVRPTTPSLRAQQRR